VYNAEKPYTPAVVVVGEGHVLPGLDKTLEDSKVGEEKKVHLAAIDAFGDRSFKFIQLVPLRDFKKQNINPYPGMVFEVEGRPARIQSVSGGRVRVDFNHPLAGKECDYELKIEAEAKTEDDRIKFLLERSFKDAPTYKVSGTKDKKKIVVDIPDAIKANKLYQVMRVIFMTEADKYLGIKDVEYNDGTPKPKAEKPKTEKKPAAKK